MSFNEIVGIIALSLLMLGCTIVLVYSAILIIKHDFFGKNTDKVSSNRVYKVIYRFAGVSNSRVFSSLREAVEFINSLESNNTLDSYEITATKLIH